jgi:hypothetical protein
MMITEIGVRVNQAESTCVAHRMVTSNVLECVGIKNLGRSDISWQD